MRPRFRRWGFQNGFSRATQAEVYGNIASDPSIFEVLNAYFGRLSREDGVCVSSREVRHAGDWHESTSFQLVHRPLGIDHALWCYRSIPSGLGDLFNGLQLQRATGRRDFSARDRVLVGEVQTALAPLIGGPLTRFVGPSPTDLSPRERRVLACLLEGDGDKQVAMRLGLSVYTVNDYTKAIFRHFCVRSRSELLARWIRQGRTSSPVWVE